MKLKLFILFFSSVFLGLAQETESKLDSLFSKAKDILEDYEVDNAISKGQHPDQYEFLRIQQLIERSDRLRKVFIALKEINERNLSDQSQINLSIRMMQLSDIITYTDYKIYYIPFNSEGGFFNRPVYFLDNLPFETEQDYERYLSWLPSFVGYLQYNREVMKSGMEEGIMAPKVIVQNIIDLLNPWTTTQFNKHPLFVPFNTVYGNLDTTRSRELKSRADRLFREKVLPEYTRLKHFLENEYYKKAPAEVGIFTVKNGKAYYENRVRHYTTLDISPDSVFRTGIAEVQRIRQQMQVIITDLKFEGKFQEFLDFLREDPQFYPSNAEQLLYKAAWISKQAEGHLPQYFSSLYEIPFTVKPVPDLIAPKYTAGRYVAGSRDANRSGIYWVNTHNLTSRSLFTLPALTLHEAVPGHHLQIMLASQLEGLPKFRESYYISAFGEGWGLYAEFLGEEMGMYQSPYELFGRYTYEIWRACRLVVDVGIHYKGWSREEAVNYLSDNSALSLHEINTEIDRYIGWPGQALSYKIGELQLKKLRKKAEEALEQNFEIREFHHAVLQNGSVPLSILERQIDTYIDKNDSQ